MRAYSRISPQFWTGTTGRALRRFPDAQRIAFYLATGPSALMTGIYYLPLPTLCYEVGITPKRARGALEVLSAEGFAEYDCEASVVWVPEMARCQVGNDPKPDDKRIKGFLRELASVPHSVFIGKFIEKYRKPFQLDEESLRKVLRGTSKESETPRKETPEDHRRGSEGASEEHRSPEPLPEPLPEPGPEPRESTLAEAFQSQVWNENRGRMPAATKLTRERRDKIHRRLKEVPGSARWIEAVRRLARGWAGTQSWATIDFLIANDTNIVKIEEGKYDRPTSHDNVSSTRSRRSSNRSPEEWEAAGDVVESASDWKPQ